MAAAAAAAAAVAETPLRPRDYDDDASSHCKLSTGNLEGGEFEVEKDDCID